MRKGVETGRTDSFWGRYGYVVLALVPFLYLIGVMARYRLDFPYLDQWELIPLLEKSYEGDLAFRDFWAQHNEHRLIFPRIIMLVLARASGWNIAWELATNIVLGAGIFVALVCQLKRTEKAIGASEARWLIPLISLLVFSMNQWENWLLGWQLQELLNVLAAVTGLMLLTDTACRWPHFVGAVLLGVVATYSFANGMSYWVIGLVALFTVTPDNTRTKYFRSGIWLAVSGLTAVSYLYDYHAPEYHPSVWLVFKHPVEYASYILKYLGAPVVNFNGVGASLSGLLGLGTFCALTRRLVRAHAVPLKLLAPYLAFALYGIASAMIIGVGRVGFGSAQAMSPRYITFANLFWVANLVLAHILLSVTPAPEYGTAALGCGYRRRRRNAVAAPMILLLALGSAYGTYRWTERYHYRLEARDELLAGDNEEMLRRIHHEPQKIIARRPFLRKHHLSIFKDFSH